MSASALSDLEKYLVDKRFQFDELGRHYSPSGIYGRVQWFLTHELSGALAVHERSHDEACELVATGYRNCDCWRRQPTLGIGESELVCEHCGRWLAACVESPCDEARTRQGLT